jgi:hypothetical protein
LVEKREDYQLLQTIPTDKLSLWLKVLSSRAHPCKVIVALANKMARIAWAVLATGKAYQAM